MGDGPRYTSEDVRLILRRVQQLAKGPEPEAAEGLTAAELLETAREVGLDQAQVAAAMAELEQEREIQAAQRELRQLSYRRFSAHLIYYLLFGGLAAGSVLWLALPVWLLAPFIIWTVLLLFHLRGVIFPDPDKLRDAARKRVDQRNLKESGRAFGQAVSRGAAALLSAAARRIDERVDRMSREDEPKRPRH